MNDADRSCKSALVYDAFLIAVSLLSFIVLAFIVSIPPDTVCSIRRTMLVLRPAQTETVSSPTLLDVSSFDGFSYSGLTSGNTNVSAQSSSNNSFVSKVVDFVPDSVPLNYTVMQYSYCNYPVYVFIDESGQMQYRVLIYRHSPQESVYGFVPATLKLTGTDLSMVFDIESEFISLSNEQFGALELEDAPVDESVGLTIIYGKKGVYLRNSTIGTEYILYGHYPNSKSAFYLGDKDGNPIPGTLSISPIWQDQGV